MLETELYPPIKAFLQARGFDVKSEILECDVVAVQADLPPLIVELKTSLSVDLLIQAVDRQSLSDTVYIAIPRGKGKRFQTQIKGACKLCRRLGVGILSVRVSDGSVIVHCDPAPYQPRKNKRRRAALLGEFDKRVGDPNTGGQTRRSVMTAYRQDVLRIVKHMSKNGPARPKDFVAQGITKAPTMLSRDYYGWFYRVERGLYDLSTVGAQAAKDYAAQIERL
ncbi:hypothetical protein GCM10007939_23480 [Amylibacter marinus]|uniref:Restriction endonuclease n=1 Tax=Amylibacter marinus TaxID=1475483 RepID=A0ABQ5VY42_9RHOB|nr:DUF2161 family putative PD-(D/E)XK-type phosphodiesterase [Amylibacter marinus]GLQ36064.1 hypothetical protein GCM10007939_23480 [Amylibacter marinus]